MNSSAPALSVILPCAGSGRRLGLVRPKELFEIFPGLCLIDFSLAHIRAALANPVNTVIRIAVVIRPWKSEVVDYVRRRFPGVTVDAVLFDDAYEEWPGSVYSAREIFSIHNLVLLPDSVLNVSKGTGENLPVCYDALGTSLVESISKALLEHKAVFGVIKCRDRRVLKKLGALRMEEGMVTAFQDKPRQLVEQYNGFWGCYAFQREAGGDLYNFLVNSVRHQPVSLQEQPFYPPGIVLLDSYTDLGTWPVIRKFRQRFASITTG
ncbi:MAG: hypothetical protein L0Y73_07870 [Candidatus Aminicenantes bacterium]|nr:hypothetical protein [Candidatus Aminicenantes bacterium]